MPASQDILNSIENRLRELAQEIAALESARSELRSVSPPEAGRGPSARRTRKRAPASTASGHAETLSEEEWLERRAAELAAQSREATAA